MGFLAPFFAALGAFGALLFTGLYPLFGGIVGWF